MILSLVLGYTQNSVSLLNYKILFSQAIESSFG